MSVTLYDEAIKMKIKALYPNTEFQSRELTFKTITDRVGEVKFPFISVFRPDGWSLSSNNTWEEERDYLNGIRQVFLDLSYQIDLYANTREDLEDITAELVLYLLRNPGITVYYSSVDGSKSVNIRSTLRYVSGPERTSELDDETVGRPYRYTLVYSLQNASLLNFAGSNPGDSDYISKITSVICNVELDKDYLLSVGNDGNTIITVYKDKEEILTR